MLRAFLVAVAILIAFAAGRSTAPVVVRSEPVEVRVSAAAPARGVSRADIVDPFAQPDTAPAIVDPFDQPKDAVLVDPAQFDQHAQQQRARADQLAEAREFGRAAGEAIRGR